MKNLVNPVREIHNLRGILHKGSFNPSFALSRPMAGLRVFSNGVNKILAVIFFLISLNLMKEYIFANSKSIDSLSIPIPDGVDFSLPKRDWNYYRIVFQDGIMPVYNKGETSEAGISLPLILKGTILGRPASSFAIIEDIASKQQNLYRLGDTVKGAKIVSMTREKVVLDYEGRKCELSLYEKKPDNSRVIVMQEKIETKVETQIVKNDIKGIFKNKIISENLKSINDIDFSKLLTQLRIKPYFESGKCIGFQLDNINAGFIKQMGLKDGDIIQSINGVRVDDPLKALQILYAIENNNPVHLSVGRGDEKIEMDCKIEG